MPGPPRKPTALRKAEGNRSKRPLPKHEPQPKGLAQCPADLPADARAVWTQYAPRYIAAGVLTELDEQAFAMLCTAYAAWKKLVQLAAEQGPVVKVNGQLMSNPHSTRADKEAARLHKLLAEFGATPAARARVMTATDADQPEADLDSFLRLAE